MLEFLLACAVGFFLFWAWLQFLWCRAGRPSPQTEKPTSAPVYDDKLITKLLDDNRTALENFVKALARYLVTQNEAEYPEILQGLASSIQFSPVKPNLNVIILQALSETDAFHREMALQRELAEVLPPDEKLQTDATNLLLTVHETATKLMSARNALAFMLRLDESSRTWDLSGQFLAAAYLYNSTNYWGRQSFASSDFRGAFLIGTHLEWRDFAGANFENAVLIYAQMTGTDLARASFRHANLTNAKVTRADMTDADLTGAKVAWSTLHLAKNVDPSWQQANFEGEKRRDNKLWRRMKAKFGAA
jgi:uncharacterized protein YjbI with pentapeptide repeats